MVGYRARRPGFLDFLGQQAPAASDLDVLPSPEVLAEWKSKNPGRDLPDPKKPKSFDLHHKPVLASFNFTQFLNDARDTQVFSQLKESYRWLHDPQVYEEALSNPPRKHRERNSRVRLESADIAMWLQDGKITEFQGTPRSCMNIFDVVEYFKLRRRGIGEPYVNDFILATSLARIKLPTRKDVRRFLHGQSTATQLDAAAFYDQFQLDPKVQQYFTFEFNGKTYAFNVLPMGFRPAADIAHLTAVAMLQLTNQQHALAYIDNFIFSGPSQQEDVTRFLRACERYGLLLNESPDFEWHPKFQQSEFDFLGEHYDLVAHTKSSTTKTLTKVRRAIQILTTYNNLISARTIAAVFGILIYASASHDISLATVFHPMRYLSFLGRSTCDWTQPAPPIDPHTLDALQLWAKMIEQNPPTAIHKELATQHDIEIQVDASAWGWGAVIISDEGTKLVQEQWPASFDATSSVIAEPMAAWLALVRAVTKDTRCVLLRSDHANLVYAIERGHAHAAPYNSFLENVLKSFPNLQLIPQHIAGVLNVTADALSRGTLTVAELTEMAKRSNAEVKNEKIKEQTCG